LFFLVVEGLSRLIGKAKREGITKGVKVSAGKTEASTMEKSNWEAYLG